MIRRYLLMWPHPSSFSYFLFYIYIFIYMIDEICSKEFYILYSTDGHLNFFFFQIHGSKYQNGFLGYNRI